MTILRTLTLLVVLLSGCAQWGKEKSRSYASDYGLFTETNASIHDLVVLDINHEARRDNPLRIRRTLGINQDFRGREVIAVIVETDLSQNFRNQMLRMDLESRNRSYGSIAHRVRGQRGNNKKYHVIPLQLRLGEEIRGFQLKNVEGYGHVTKIGVVLAKEGFDGDWNGPRPGDGRGQISLNRTHSEDVFPSRSRGGSEKALYFDGINRVQSVSVTVLRDRVQFHEAYAITRNGNRIEFNNFDGRVLRRGDVLRYSFERLGRLPILSELVIRAEGYDSNAASYEVRVTPNRSTGGPVRPPQPPVGERPNPLECKSVNVYGKYAAGGGCNTYGCYYPGGGCNVYGCYERGGSCSVRGCSRKAPSTKKACVEVDQRGNRVHRSRCNSRNIYGNYARGGGCNTYGCYYPGGGCNVYGCYYEGGSCNTYGCVRKQERTNRACVE